MFIDTVSDGIHPKVLNVRNHPSVSFKWKTSLLFYYFIHMLFNLIDGAWLPDSHDFNLIAVHVNLIYISLKCCMKVLIPMNAIIQSIHAFKSHLRRMTAWRIPTPLLIGLTICGVAGAHLYHISIKHEFETIEYWIESFYGGFNGVSAWTWILHRISYEKPLECRLNAFLRYVWHNPLNHSIWTMVSYTMKCENIVNIP